MEEKKESCNISFSRELVEKAMKDSAEKNDEQAYETFRGHCIAFFKKFGSSCDCSECKDFILYILGQLIIKPAHKASLEFEVPLFQAAFKIGEKEMTINIQLKKDQEPPIS